MNDSIIPHLANLRKLFAEAAPEDSKVISDYAWTIVKALVQHTTEIDSHTARQLLADCLKLPIERPSLLYSALLGAAIKVYYANPKFHFDTFLRMWGIDNLRPEDAVPQKSRDGKSYPSITERTAKILAHLLLQHTETAAANTRPDHETDGFESFLAKNGYAIHPMLVIRIKEAMAKDGRKYHFVTLASPEGIEVETVSHTLLPSPFHPLPEGKRHYVNIGQLYICLLRTKQKQSHTNANFFSTAEQPKLPRVTTAFLSHHSPTEYFYQEIGYIESIDTNHGHMHIYDALSRHFVAPIQRFSKEKAEDFVRIIPIIPQNSKFKTAIIQNIVPSDSSEVKSVLREIRITNINRQKAYATWELIDKTRPIAELLSPLQISQGETSPIFTSGYLNLTEELAASFDNAHNHPQASTLNALIYLKRGKDRHKRPHIAKLF